MCLILTDTDLKQIKNLMLETMEPFFAQIYNKLIEHDQKFIQIDQRLDQIENRLDKLENRMDALESRMDNLETRMDALENRMDALENYTKALDNRISSLENRIFYIEDSIIELKHFHKDLNTTLNMIKRLFGDLTFKTEKLEDKLFELENGGYSQEDILKNRAELKIEIESLKKRIDRLELLVDKVCEEKEKYNI